MRVHGVLLASRVGETPGMEREDGVGPLLQPAGGKQPTSWKLEGRKKINVEIKRNSENK